MFPPYNRAADFISDYNENFRENDKQALLAIVLKAGTITRTDSITGETSSFDVEEGTFAGFSGLEGQPERATADLGALILSTFHRTFVGTNANALLLHHLLDGQSQGGLGLRRVQWQANASNEASVRMAKRLGFQLEGLIRWQQIMPIGKVGSEGAEIDREGLPRVGWDGRDWGAGRHTALLALCWDDWLNGGRDRVDVLVKRTQNRS